MLSSVAAKIRRLLPDFSSQSVKQASALLAVTALLSNVLGLGRNLIFYRLIRPDQLDSYFASFRLSDFIFNLLIFGAITSAVIPLITELITSKKEGEAWEAINQLLGVASLILAAVILVLALFMTPLVHLLVSGFDQRHLALTVLLSRLMLLQTLFFAWSFIVGALLNGYRRFTAYALAPLTYNLALIVGGVLAGYYGVLALTYCVVIGAFLHFLIQYLEVRTTGFRFHPVLRLGKTSRTILRLMLPRSLTQGMNQIVLIVYTSLASYLPAGSISIFNGMNDLQTTPTVIVANSLATAYFPTLSAQAALNSRLEQGLLLSKALRITLFLLLPCLTVGYILRQPLVDFYLGMGSNSRDLIGPAIPTLSWFLVGIIPAAIVTLLSRLFYAFKDTVTPMLVGLVTGLVGIGIAIISIRYYGAPVAFLAAAESSIALLQCLLYWWLLRRRGLLTVSLPVMFKSIFNYSLGALLAALGSWLVLNLLTSRLISNSPILALAQLILGGGIGILIYLGYSTLRSQEEIQWIRRKTFSTNP